MGEANLTIDEFTIQTKTIEEFYDKSFNVTQKKIWYDELKNYTAERYEKAIRKLCKISQYRPTLSAVLGEISKVNLREYREGVACQLCKGIGYVLYRKEINGYQYEYACLCNCENAKGLEYDGTKIADKEHRQPYYLKSAEEVFGYSVKQQSKDLEYENINFL